MALRVLVYSKMPLTAPTLAPVFKGLGMEAEVCADAFAAIDKGTKRPFSCVVVDWADQPEASFLLKRARQSTLNANIIAVAIVDHEPAPVEIREHRLDFLLYRPITVGEAAAVLTKACREIQVSPAPILETEPEPELQSPLEQLESDKKPPDPEDPDLVSVTAPVPKPPHAAVVQREVREKPAARWTELRTVRFATEPSQVFLSPRIGLGLVGCCCVLLVASPRNDLLPVAYIRRDIPRPEGINCSASVCQQNRIDFSAVGGRVRRSRRVLREAGSGPR
jgi:hypothetical protein